MTNFLFNGYYGYKNIGDDVFCVVADWGSRHYWGASQLAFLSSELPVLSQPAKNIIPQQKKYPGHQTIARTLSALEARHMVYFGGSTLHSKQESWVNILRNPLIQNIGLKSISASGVSVGPFKSVQAEKEIKKLLSEMRFISVRDRTSYDIVKAMNIHTPLVQSFDPALLMLDVMDREIHEKAPFSHKHQVIGISVCNVERYSDGNLRNEQLRIDSVKATVKHLARHGHTLRFFVFNGHATTGDDTITDEVIASLDGYPHVEKIPYHHDPKVVFTELSRCNAIFGVRLHAAILAYTASVPFVLVEYHRKCSDFLDEIGYSTDKRIGDAQADPVEVANYISKLASLDDSSQLWSRSVGTSLELARLNFTAAPYMA